MSKVVLHNSGDAVFARNAFIKEFAGDERLLQDVPIGFAPSAYAARRQIENKRQGV